MLNKLTTIALVTVASINCQDYFLSNPAESGTTKVYQSIAQIDGPLKWDLKFNCQYMAGLNFYDLRPLGYEKDHYSYTDLVRNKTIFISFCNNLPPNVLETAGCSTNIQSMSILRDSKGVCHILTGNNPKEDTSFNILNTDDDNGLAITYKGGESNYGLVVDMTCDVNKDFEETFLDTSISSAVNLKVNSKYGCQNG